MLWWHTHNSRLEHNSSSCITHGPFCTLCVHCAIKQAYAILKTESSVFTETNCFTPVLIPSEKVVPFVFPFSFKKFHFHFCFVNFCFHFRFSSPFSFSHRKSRMFPLHSHPKYGDYNFHSHPDLDSFKTKIQSSVNKWYSFIFLLLVFYSSSFSEGSMERENKTITALISPDRSTWQ